MGFGEVSAEAVEQAKQKADGVLKFYIEKLGDATFFGGDETLPGRCGRGYLCPPLVWSPGFAHARLPPS